jgi:hypothetical protein
MKDFLLVNAKSQTSILGNKTLLKRYDLQKINGPLIKAYESVFLNNFKI